MSSLICRWCKGGNVKALGENTQCFDCGRLAEHLTYAPEPVEADQTPEEAEEAAALAAEIEAEGAAAATVDANDEPVVTAPLPEGSPLSRAKVKK